MSADLFQKFGENVSASIASVTVAYNAARVLPRQMEALRRQSRSLNEIVVVDNASSDNTISLLSEQYPNVKVLKMTENLGVGGALAAGIQYAAIERKHDWIWTFDDDSVPNDDALQALLGTPQSSDSTTGILASLPVHKETGSCYRPLLWQEGFIKPSPALLQQPVWLADLVISSGSMVRREVVEAIGLPRSDFFMDFIDFEYCLRARSRGFKIAVVTNSQFAHEIGDASKVWIPGYSRPWPDHAPWREYYMSRNIAYAAWWLYPSYRTKRFVLYHLARHAAGVLLFGSRKLAGLKRMAQGFWDGRRANLGIRFRPS